MPTAQPRTVSWTPEEDERLASAVVSCKSRIIPPQLLSSHEPTGGSKICWKKVALSMPGRFTGLLHQMYLLISLYAGRNNKSCRKRWLHSLDPNLRKGEDEPFYVSRFPSLCPIQVVGHPRRMLPFLNLSQSMANDGTRLPGRFLEEPMTSVRSATRKPSIRPSVGAAVLSILKY